MMSDLEFPNQPCAESDGMNKDWMYSSDQIEWNALAN